MGKYYERIGPYTRKKRTKETKPREDKNLSPIEEIVQAEKRAIIEGRERKIS